MKSHELLDGLGVDLKTIENFEVDKVVFDHREATENSIFVAIKGLANDGHIYIDEALTKGLKVAVVESKSKLSPEKQLQVKNSRWALSHLANEFYGRPSEKLKVVGITGTNGKTSCSLMIEAILKSANIKAGVIGTIDHHLGEKVWPTNLTTADPITIQKRLSEFVQMGAKAAVMEVSSHSLAQYRVDHILFDVAVFTNLSRDHLDYHKDFEDYFAAKSRLFTELLNNQKGEGVAVINADDSYATQLIHKINNTKSFGEKNCDYSFQITNSNFDKTEFKLNALGNKLQTSIPLIGKHNVYNAVASALATDALGVNLETSLRALSQFSEIAGRLQKVPNNKSLNVFIDYAHTDDALRSTLNALSEIRNQQSDSKSKIYVVFGCGGDRDRGKRPLMARVAEKYADHIIVTSDNPRTEDPKKIIEDILKGFESEKPVKSLVDRREAINFAINSASKNDVVLVAGKGHENYQILGATKVDFSDYNEALKALSGN